jgi:hypothetical protein
MNEYLLAKIKAWFKKNEGYVISGYTLEKFIKEVLKP